MDNTQEELLAKELAKAGKLGGKLGGGIAGSVGGWLGAKIAAKVLPTEQYEQQVVVAQRMETVLTKVATFLASQGRIVNEDEAGESIFPKLTGILGSGFLNANPAVVRVEVLIATDSACTVRVRAAAKESIIRQRTAERAVERVVDFLRSLGTPNTARSA